MRHNGAPGYPTRGRSPTKWRIAAVWALLLASPAVDPALAACVNQKCPDAALVATARAEVESRCGCLREGQTHKKYTTCVKKLMKAADLTALVPNKKCRQLIVLLL